MQNGTDPARCGLLPTKALELAVDFKTGRAEIFLSLARPPTYMFTVSFAHSAATRMTRVALHGRKTAIWARGEFLFGEKQKYYAQQFGNFLTTPDTFENLFVNMESGCTCANMNTCSMLSQATTLTHRSQSTTTTPQTNRCSEDFPHLRGSASQLKSSAWTWQQQQEFFCWHQGVSNISGTFSTCTPLGEFCQQKTETGYACDPPRFRNHSVNLPLQRTRSDRELQLSATPCRSTSAQRAVG